MGGGKFPLYVNPNRKQSNALLDRFHQEYPDSPQKGKGEIKTRSTYSKNGDEFEWMSGDSDHYNVEQYILKRFGLKTNQAWN